MRETATESAPNGASNDGACFRVFKDGVGAALDVCKKREPESALFSAIVRSRFDEFVLCMLVEANDHSGKAGLGVPKDGVRWAS